MFFNSNLFPEGPTDGLEAPTTLQQLPIVEIQVETRISCHLFLQEFGRIPAYLARLRKEKEQVSFYTTSHLKIHSRGTFNSVRSDGEP